MIESVLSSGLKIATLSGEMEPLMEDEKPKAGPTETIVPLSTTLPSKTFRLKLATSLQAHVERVAQHQGVSVSYLITKAIEEKIARFRHNEVRHRDQNCVHLVKDL